MPQPLLGNLRIDTFLKRLCRVLMPEIVAADPRNFHILDAASKATREEI